MPSQQGDVEDVREAASAPTPSSDRYCVGHADPNKDISSAQWPNEKGV